MHFVGINLVIALSLISCSMELSTGSQELLQKSSVVLLARLSSLTSTPVIICKNQGYCIVFRTTSTFAGTAVGGVSGADTKCNADANKPANTGTYKALITDGAARVACTSANCATSGIAEHSDWVMYPATEYRQVNQTTVIFTTNANGIFILPGALAGWDGTASSFNSGFNSNWTASGGNHCTAWTIGGGSGMQGIGNSTSATMLQNASIGCGSVVSLLSVQQ
ncbi:MAG TPA: DUF1554 domain-containing protein [Leptospiraceae bacterium]|nr:DUF1554 domain-containing protein [Leptospirales bacterium]HMU83384.1 DUF1554 domain-containing protein [Leptospiraceae bacterium]HMX57155.1 DUF1554 domain-containing protein [Leptospiraceae bacterium]HMZ36161.1 DUF1554 domain-containing protein [Leptospiraceae bacterium]HNE22737.1 DUF1554 domain-containing protein [Leptospiraceae bacterium]